MLRRVAVALVVLACTVGVVAYQVTRPARAPANPEVFVPSPQFFQDFSPSFRTSISDAYYLMMVQYFGEHVSGDKRLDSLPEFVDLVTVLSPHFTRAYLFAAFALIDADLPEASYSTLQRGFRENPGDWRFPAFLGYFTYAFGKGETKDIDAAKWYAAAAAIPGSPDYLQRLAAALLAKGGEEKKAVLMYGQAYLAGDKYAREKAVNGLEGILPKEKEARMKAVAPLYQTMPEDEFDALIAQLFKDYLK